MRYQVLITFPEKPCGKEGGEYPLSVVVIDNGVRLQDHYVKSLRDGRILGNGICYGGMLSNINNNDWPVNPTIDPRLLETEVK